MPSTLAELYDILKFCRRVNKWKPVYAGSDIKLMVQDFKIHSIYMPIVDGKLVWDRPLMRLYKLFRDTVVKHIDV